MSKSATPLVREYQGILVGLASLRQEIQDSKQAALDRKPSASLLEMQAALASLDGDASALRFKRQAKRSASSAKQREPKIRTPRRLAAAQMKEHDALIARRALQDAHMQDTVSGSSAPVLPRIAAAIHPENPCQVILVIEGQSGYHNFGREFATAGWAAYAANRYNDGAKIEPKMREALLMRSMFPDARVSLAAFLDAKPYSEDGVAA